MATIKEQEELIEVLKWTPRTYRVSIYGYGGEIAMGKIKSETVDYFKKNLISVENYSTSYAEEGDEEYIEVPEDLQPFTQGNWYDCDDIEHCSGPEFNGSTIVVDDENGNTIWEQELGYNLEDLGCEINCFCEESIDEYVNKDQAVFVGQSFEKGTFFESEIELTEPFDPEKFKFTFSEIAGWQILNIVEYNSEELDGSGGYSTTGKSMAFNFYYEDKQGDIQEYDSPTDEDLGVPAYGPSPESWEQSPKFKFKQHKPVHQGWYSANWGYGSTYGSLYWDGTRFVEFNYGNPSEITSVVTWSGYNWDTSSWVNQPPTPVDTECNKCGWTGMRDDLRDDDDGSYCPECGNKNWDWIDYDPDTAKGRKNRAKYCKPWDPALALDRIKPAASEDTFDWSPLDDDDDEYHDYECVQCEWSGTVDEVSYDDNDNMICPECGEPIELIEYKVKVNTNTWNDVKVTPAVEGQYEVKNTHTPVWPFPASFEATWTGQAWVDSDGDQVPNVIEWRELNV